MNSKLSQKSLKKEKITEDKFPTKKAPLVQSQACYLSSKVHRLTGKRSYIQMPLSEKKQVRDSTCNKTKPIQKLHKKQTNRKQKTQEQPNIYFDEDQLIYNHEYIYESIRSQYPQREMGKQQQNTSVGEISNNDERQKLSQIDITLIQDDNYKNQNNSSNSGNNLEKTYSQDSHLSERTITEKCVDGALGFVLEDDDDIISQTIPSIPQTPMNLTDQEMQTDYNNTNQIKLINNQKELQITKKQSDEQFHNELLTYLSDRINYYKVSKVIFLSRHPEITQKNRQILIDWLMDVSDKFSLKRQTLQLAINFADRYLMQVRNFELDNYQRLGISCLLIASKIEEIYYPKHIDFQSITDDNCSLEEILEQETDILTKLNWLVNPPTLNYWANIYMMRWDQYANSNPLGLDLLNMDNLQYQQQQIQDNMQLQLEIPKFKSDDNKHYLNYRHVMQTLDFALMDIDSYLYDPRHLSISSIVIMLALHYQKLTLEQIQQNLENHKQNLRNNQQQLQANNLTNNTNFLDYIYDNIVCQEYDEFSHMIINFIEFHCDVRVTEIKQALRFMQLFYTVPIQTHMPQKLQDHNSTTSQEEFYSYQVYYNDLDKIMDQLKMLKTDLKFA